jgi:hypothetical protein
MTHGNGLPLALFSWGVTFDLKQRRRHAALTGHGISSAARRARANAQAPWPRPQRQRWWTCSRPLIIRTSVRAKSLVSGLRAVPLPSSGCTHLAVRLTVGNPHPDSFLA